MTRVKICGITRPVDARVAREAGADYLGAILSPGFSRSVEPEVAAEYRGPEEVTLVGVMVDPDPATAADRARRAGVGVIQLHGDEDPEVVEAIRGRGPWRVWKAVQVRTADEVHAALDRFAGRVDGLLLDGWHPDARGGVGASFPWHVVEPMRDAFPDGLTFIAAGGLTPANVAEVVARLRPDVVDVSSGVEVHTGEKSADGVRAFIRNAAGVGGS